AATTNESGNRSTGCAQCLKYKEHLSQKFFICIDSDLQYLLEENISAEQGILQTYTYSWENHCAFASKLQQTFEELFGKGAVFNFECFLHQYSEIVYEPFLFMLYQEKNGLTTFCREHFKKCISLQYRTGDELDNGKMLIQRLKDNLTESIGDEKDDSDFSLEQESQYYIRMGLTSDNAYLFVRGHCLYNYLVSIGAKLCRGTGVDFEQNILKTTLAYDQYEEISKISRDIYSLAHLRSDL
ncbi:DUF4435 domain-containing protein, partial [Parabacteroides sp. OttesenSCG-928-N08]|nr:DUF4435 domain-containing protein [Parabacteroides sp. OttesenSCG-928-N08]